MVLITPRLVRALEPDEVPPLPTLPRRFLPGPAGGREAAGQRRARGQRSACSRTRHPVEHRRGRYADDARDEDRDERVMSSITRRRRLPLVRV